MAETPNGDGYAQNFDRRLDRINDTITALTESMLAMRSYMQERHKLATVRHEQNMEEIRELIALHREHRMALFQLMQKKRE